jgi:hypothetical protein
MANMSKITENHFFKILPFTVQNRFFKNQWKKHQNRQIRILRKLSLKRFKGQNVTFHTIFDLLAFEEFLKITSSKSLMKYISTFMSMEPECFYL